MKVFSIIIGILFFSVFLTQQGHAQFLKKLTEKVAERVENKRQYDTEDASENTIEQIGDEDLETVDVEGKEISEEGQTAGRMQTPTASSIASDQLENDSQLQENYKLKRTGSGPDLYLEYRVESEGAQSETYQMDMRMKMVASPSTGKGRSEMVMKVPVIGEMRMVTLSNANDPLEIVVLNERKKQYSIIKLPAMEENAHKDAYTVKRLGEELIHGLRCIHVMADNSDGQTFELWTTQEIPAYEKLTKLYSNSQGMGSGDLWGQLQRAGAAGLVVKLRVSIEEGFSVMRLIKIENLNAPLTLFNIPPGYEEKKGGWVKRYMERYTQ